MKTVKELIVDLKKLDQNLIVIVGAYFDTGYDDIHISEPFEVYEGSEDYPCDGKYINKNELTPDELKKATKFAAIYLAR